VTQNKKIVQYFFTPEKITINLTQPYLEGSIKLVSIFFQTDSNTIIVSGKTYPYREDLRSLGAQYMSQDKVWHLPNTAPNLLRVEELCRSIGGGRAKAPRTDALTLPSTLTELTAGPAKSSCPPDGLTVAELMQQVQLAISQNFPRSLWIVGEIQNFRQTASGSYFQLAEFKEGASRSATMTVNATIWRSQLADMEAKLGRDTLKELLLDGLRVRILADVSLFKDRGQVSLQVQAIDPSFTKGSLALAREKLLRELRAKGLDQINKSWPWPAFPFKIGLISADDSRAKTDFLDQLLVYGFPGQVVFFAAQMQGEATLKNVVAGLKALEASACDMIVVTRGGGSAADLRWFDSPDIAYAIAAAKIPIVAAIGHHEDVSVAEEICGRREKTPTAAADFCIQLFAQSRERIKLLSLAIARKLDERMRLQTHVLQMLKTRLHVSSNQICSDYKQHLQILSNEIAVRAERRLLQAHSLQKSLQSNLQQELKLQLLHQDNQLQRLSQALLHQAQSKINPWQYQRERLEQALSLQAQRSWQIKLDNLLALEKCFVQADPRPWLAQGWTQFFTAGKSLQRAEQLHVGQSVKARILDALLDLQVTQIEPLSNKRKAKP